MAFICGSSGTQEDDFEVLWPSQKKTTTRRHSFCSRSNNKDSKNPYSNRGLDKFEALLADLDGKRQKIFTQKGSEDISFVRFVYSNSNDVKPIVVKIKDQRKLDHNKLNNFENPKITTELSSPRPTNSNKSSGTVAEVAQPSIDLCKKKDQWRRKIGDWWKPWYCLPLFVILILVFLVFFGRSFAILCTSLGWYLVPATSEINPKRLKKIVKKDNARKSSEKMIMSPRSVLNSEQMNNQPHRKSF